MATRPECTPGRIFVPRWVQLAVLPALLIVAWFALGAIGQVIFIFLVAGLIALVLNPLVHGLERVRVHRYRRRLRRLRRLRRRARPRGGARCGRRSCSSCATSRPPCPAWPTRPATRSRACSACPTAPASTSTCGADHGRRSRRSPTACPQFTANVVDVGVTVVRQITLPDHHHRDLDLHAARREAHRALRRRALPHAQRRATARSTCARAKTAVVDYVKAQVLLSAALGASVGLAMWFLSMIGAFPSGARYALFFGVWAAPHGGHPLPGPRARRRPADASSPSSTRRSRRSG